MPCTMWVGSIGGICSGSARIRMKFTHDFEATRLLPDRAMIRHEWIERAVRSPIKESIQADGRIRRWAQIKEADNRYLRVVLLEDGETLHNAFFDRDFKL